MAIWAAALRAQLESYQQQLLGDPAVFFGPGSPPNVFSVSRTIRLVTLIETYEKDEGVTMCPRVVGTLSAGGMFLRFSHNQGADYVEAEIRISNWDFDGGVSIHVTDEGGRLEKHVAPLENVASCLYSWSIYAWEQEEDDVDNEDDEDDEDEVIVERSE